LRDATTAAITTTANTTAMLHVVCDEFLLLL
jgi:hypothetical protein